MLELDVPHPGLCLPFAPMWQCTKKSCHIIVLLQARFWRRALSHVYSCTGSKRGQLHNREEQVGCSTTVWETPSHTKESKQRHRKGKNSARIKEIAIFPYSILPRLILQKTFPQHNSDISQKLLWNNNGPFHKLTTDIKFIGAAVKNILYAVKNIFQAPHF